MEQYEVKLEQVDYEGPLDLLLHLIRKNEINLYDIPIAFILTEYLTYLRTLEEIDVQVSSEFLVMVGRLIHIKSKMLLPSQWLDEDPDDLWYKQFEDPRADLVRQLAQRIRLIAIREQLDELRRRELRAMYTFRRGADLSEFLPQSPGTDFGELSLSDLLGNYEIAINRKKEMAPITLNLDRVNIKDIIKSLLQKLKRGVRVFFGNLVDSKPTYQNIIGSFLALLDLAKDGKVELYQENYNSPLEVEKV